MIFFLPFPPLPATAGAPSGALIPAFTVSTRTPDGNAGEYGEMRLASEGIGSGGLGKGLESRFGGFAPPLDFNCDDEPDDFDDPSFSLEGFAAGGVTGTG